jgi:hypothetical protein
MIVFRATSAAEALKQAKRRGRDDEFKYKNSDGNTVYFEFVGVLELARLGIECGPDEVWYQISDMMMPMERRGTILPPESRLWAVALERLMLAQQKVKARESRRMGHRKV